MEDGCARKRYTRSTWHWPYTYIYATHRVNTRGTMTFTEHTKTKQLNYAHLLIIAVTET